jgi:hypothetical protein
VHSRRSGLVVVLQLIILACGPLNPLATPAGDSHVDITPGVIQSTPTASSSEAPAALRWSRPS